jgi:hypothetical protein
MAGFYIGVIMGLIGGFFLGRWFCTHYQVTKKGASDAKAEAVPPPPPTKKPKPPVKKEGGE